jgi:hypothetical protein
MLSPSRLKRLESEPFLMRQGKRLTSVNAIALWERGADHTERTRWMAGREALC